jgi:hypothetical protein
MKPPVYLVIVNFNGWSDTIECLESVLRSDFENTRVIVVDNGSADGSMEKLLEWANGTRSFQPSHNAALRALTWPPVPKPVNHRAVEASEQPFRDRDFPTVTFISSSSNLGFAGGNNVALKPLVEGGVSGYACLLNNDMVVAPGAVRALVDALEKDAQLAALGAVIFEYDQPDVVQAIGGGRMSRLLGMSDAYGAGLRRDEIKTPRSLGYVSGSCLLTRLETLRRVGLMDEKYFLYAEDADWGERMRRHGYRLGCATDAFVWHKGSQTSVARSPFQDYYLVRGALLFVRKHAPQFVPVAAAYSVVRCLVPKIVRGQWRRARSVVRAYADYARGY